MQPIPASIQAFLTQHDIRDGSERTQLLKLVQAVANIPWGEGRTLEDVLETKHVGTCTGKHLVLAGCLDALEIPYRTVVCTFRWSEQNIQLPENLTKILQEGEWFHGHNFMQLQASNKGWIDIDVTWDPELGSSGFLSLPGDWNGETSFVGVRNMQERMDNANISTKKKLLASLTPEMQKRREQFLEGFFLWIKKLRT